MFENQCLLISTIRCLWVCYAAFAAFVMTNIPQRLPHSYTVTTGQLRRLTYLSLLRKLNPGQKEINKNQSLSTKPLFSTQKQCSHQTISNWSRWRTPEKAFGGESRQAMTTLKKRRTHQEKKNVKLKKKNGDKQAQNIGLRMECRAGTSIMSACDWR